MNNGAATELETCAQLKQHLAANLPLNGVVMQDLDLTNHEAALLQLPLTGVVTLGCTMSRALTARFLDAGSLVFPRLDKVPYTPYRSRLYRVDDLYDQYDLVDPDSYKRCLDARVYQHWKQTGEATPKSILETLARRLHDHAITDALSRYLAPTDVKVIAVMGGHSLDRSGGGYLDVAHIARSLSQEGFLLTSGGGPGAMEATHLGCHFAGRSDDELSAATEMLAQAPRYDHKDWLKRAFEVRKKYPQADADAKKYRSLGIPTWLYGHEPPNAFATDIAKYFANSVREDGLLAIASHGVVFSPGSAGTIQEIFQDACQNHYRSHGGIISPMVFLGRDYWTKEKAVYPLLADLAAGHPYARWLTITDSRQEAVDHLLHYAASDDAPH